MTRRKGPAAQASWPLNASSQLHCALLHCAALSLPIATGKVAHTTPSFVPYRSWTSGLVHGGCVEMVLDELTAEVMKVNVAPQNLTAEITFKLKKPSLPGMA